MSEILGQQFVVENVPGAGGITGAARVARAEPDGYTLLIHQTEFAIQPALDKGLPFNLERDLIAVGLVNRSNFFLVGRKSLPANNMNELVSWMRNSSTPAKFAHPGVGSLGHLATIVLARSTNVDVNPIPYRGVGPAMNDLVAGHVDLLCAGSVSAVPLIKSGTIKAYAFANDKRSDLIPEIRHRQASWDTRTSQRHSGMHCSHLRRLRSQSLRSSTPRYVKLLGIIGSSSHMQKVAWSRFSRVNCQLMPQTHMSELEVAKWDKVVRENNITPRQ